MVKIVYGPKGFGKTKIMLQEVNDVVETSKGDVVFITDKISNTVDIKLSVRCLKTEDHGISNYQYLIGFINGLLAGNSDIEYIFIDGLKRIIGNDLIGGKDVFCDIERLEQDYPNLNFVISLSAEKDELPPYIKKYV